MMFRFILTIALACISSATLALEPIPDKLVVLTFDDSAKSHFTIVRPVLKKYGFGATFFITEGFDFRENKRDYMTWDEIAQLHKDGFEIGNHTRDHLGLNAKNLDRVTEQLSAINARCLEHKIPKTTSFAWPGNSTDEGAFELLRKAGIEFARRGGAPEHPYETGEGFAYQPGLDHPLLIPSAGDARPKWELEDFITAVNKARHGRIAVLQFHGAPDTAHSWVSTSKAKFESYMKYLALNKFTVVSMRDLRKYVDFRKEPKDARRVIKDRQRLLDAKRSDTNFPKPQCEEELKR